MDTIKRIILSIVLVLVAFSYANSQTISKSKDEYSKIVAQDGSGDYTTIQKAIDDSKSFPYQRITIFVKNGTYYEKLEIHEWNSNISLIGESKEKTVISYDDYFSKINSGINSTFKTYTVLVEGDGFVAKNITIQNTSGEVGQAVALTIHANQVAIFNCNILGNQDTLYVTGSGFKNYFKDCYIEGTTDFIFGSATAYFENCIIHSLKDSYITAASTPEGIEYGFVFNNCSLKANKNVTQVYLGRPWRIYAKTVFLNCKMDNHIRPEGWHNWSKTDAEKSSFYAEYNCSGAGYSPKTRVNWSYQLDASQAQKYTEENCLGVSFYDFIKNVQ